MSNKTTLSDQKYGPEIKSVTTEGATTISTSVDTSASLSGVSKSIKETVSTSNLSYPYNSTVTAENEVNFKRSLSHAMDISTSANNDGTHYRIATDLDTGVTTATKGKERDAMTRDGEYNAPTFYQSRIKDENGNPRIESSIPFGSNDGWKKTTVVDEVAVSPQVAARAIRMNLEGILDRDEALGGKVRENLIKGKVALPEQMKAFLPAHLEDFRDLPGGYGDAPARPDVPNHKPAAPKGKH